MNARNGMTAQPPSKPDGRPTDLELLRQVAAASREALGELYDRHAALLFGAIVQIVPERAAAEAALEQTFMDIWDRAASFDAQIHAPLGWFVVLARAQAVRLRHAGTIGARALPAGSPALRFETTLLENPPPRAAGGLGPAVREWWHRLPAEARSVVEVTVLNGLGPGEIAEMLGKSVGTVRAELRDAMKRLRAELRSEL